MLPWSSGSRLWALHLLPLHTRRNFNGRKGESSSHRRDMGPRRGDPAGSGLAGEADAVDRRSQEDSAGEMRSPGGCLPLLGHRHAVALAPSNTNRHDREKEVGNSESQSAVDCHGHESLYRQGQYNLVTTKTPKLLFDSYLATTPVSRLTWHDEFE
ncbi:hypothetical protein GUJ93_ZPchr0001g31611 [Zizania palustris]|uniref:Uncharacterized protein n=1 Tax=Zizania palustris TaxID=103762 RepID=A0A8J5V9U5_ZIZPA|nr:hypothetical protein GUJ93_ZPchr0001g31611 [Zizania palustris]